jgi:hypothetical protein
MVLLAAVYYRINLTLWQVAPFSDISKSAAGEVVNHLAPHLPLAPVPRGTARIRSCSWTARWSRARPQRGGLKHESS